jgi:hypothetical protein
LIRVDENSVVKKVRVVAGETIAAYDTTGTLTQKYQAKSRKPINESRLVVQGDTAHVLDWIRKSPAHVRRGFVPIDRLFERLVRLTGTAISNPGMDQERNRGAALHRAVCKCLGKRDYSDCGRFPDVPDQLLEVKLQTAPTIDLGLVCPDSVEPIAGLPDFRHCDVRYAVFYGSAVSKGILLDHVVLTTGADFFSFFQRFEGKITNKKLQIPLPADFFE